MKGSRSAMKSKSYDVSRITAMYLFTVTCVVPLFFMPFSDYDAFRQPKFMLWAIAVLSTSALMILGSIQSKCSLNMGFRDDIYVVLCFYVMIWVISTIGSVDRTVSITGIAFYNGMIQLLLCILTFLLVVQFYQFELGHIRYILTAYCIIAAYCLIQFFDVDPLAEYYGENARNLIGHTFATIGNQNQVASCLSVVFVLSAFFYILGIGKDQWFYFAASTTIFAGTVSTSSRAGLLAIGFAFAVSLPYVFKQRVLKRYLIICAACCAILIILDISSGGGILERYFTIFGEGKSVLEGNLDSELGSRRMEIWINSVDLIQKYWLVGSGPDTFFIVYNNLDVNMQPAVIAEDDFFISPHNESLRLLIETGIFSLAAYWAIVITVIRKGIKQSENNPMVIPFLLALVCYLVKGMFNCSVVTDMILFWVLSALIYSLIEKFAFYRYF